MLRFLIISLLTIVLFAGCKKDKDLNIKYEIVTTAPIIGPFPTILTKVGFGTSTTHNNFTSGTTWTYTETEGTEYRPLTLVLNVGTINFNQPGSATVTLSVNGQVKDQKSTTAVQQGSVYMASPMVAT